MSFDIEDFRNYFVDLFKANLNTEISNINTEKADSVTLDTFVDAQYVSDLNEKVLNYDKFILHEIVEINTIPNVGMGFATEVSIGFNIVVSESEGGTLSEQLVLRYTQSMLNVLQGTFSNISRFSDLEIQAFAPLDIRTALGTQYTKAGVILIKGTIA